MFGTRSQAVQHARVVQDHSERWIGLPDSVGDQRRRVPHIPVKPTHLVEPTMIRDDVLVWLSLAWFVGLCGAAIWVLSSPAYDIFGI